MFRTCRTALRVGLASRRGLASGPSRGPLPATPRIAAASEAEAETVRSALQRLLRPEASSSPSPSPSPSSSAGRWSLSADGGGLERPFKFKNFTKTWDFMTAVALQCKLKNHHPEWSNVYNTTFVRWTTHSPTPGLTRKDVELAALCDELGRAFGEASEKPVPSCSLEASPSGSPTSLADKAAALSGGDCCTPKK